jgi:predicted kinase
VYLRIDSIERALQQSDLKLADVADAGYCAGYALAEDNLRLGWRVVADSVNPLELTRAAWRAAAARAQQPCIEIEVLCSDAAEHRRRVESRTAAAPADARVPTWAQVQARSFEPWTGDVLRIDTAGRDPQTCAEALLARLRDKSLLRSL